MKRNNFAEMLMVLFSSVVIFTMDSQQQTVSNMASLFPLGQFLSDTSVINEVEWNGYQCQNQTYDTRCNCSNGCQNSGDCCIDFVWNRNENNNMEFNTRKYIQKIRKATNKEFSCLPLFPFTEIKEYFIMVDSCLQGADQLDVQKCKDSSTLGNTEQVPVMGDDHNLYKNKFCAKCNFIDRYSFKGLRMTCPISPRLPSYNILQVLQQSELECSMKADDNYENKVLRCVPSLCNPDYSLLCRAIIAQGKCGFGTFRNLYCRMCLSGRFNGKIYIGKKCTETGNGPFGPSPPSWSQTINLNDIFKQSDDFCPSGTIQDLDGRCIPKECGRGYLLVMNDCQKNIVHPFRPTSVRSDYIVQRCLQEMNVEHALFVFIDISNNQTITEFFERFPYEWTCTYVNKTTIIYKSNNLSNDINIDWINTKAADISIFNISKIVLAPEDNLETLLYGFDLTRTFRGSKICSSIVPVTNFTKMYNKSNTCSAVMKHQLKFTPIMNAIHKITMEQLNFNIIFQNGVIEEWAYYCKQFHLDSDCFRKNIHPENITIDNYKTIHFGAARRTYAVKVNEYAPTSTGFQVCIGKINNQYEVMPRLDRIREAKYLVSIIGTTLSVIAYLSIILVFALIPELRNVGGMYILVLVILLLISDLIFLVILSGGRDMSTLGCRWFGLILHWMLLSVCCWSIVLAMDITMQFSKKTSNVARRSTKTLYRRLSVTMISTTCIMLTVVFLNETDTLNFNYDQTCWIGNFYLKLAFFFIPTVMTYLICMLCLILILVSIKQSKNQTDRLLKDSVNQDRINLLRIGVKLMVVLGISESIGLIQVRSTNPTESELLVNNIFGVFYDVARSLRGVFIFFVCIINKQTIKLIQKKRKSKHSSHFELNETKSSSMSS